MTQMQEAMISAVAAAVAKALGPSLGKPNGKSTKSRTQKGKRGKKRAKLTDAERAAFIAKNDAEAIAQFTAAGYADVQPRVNVLTYDKWIANGRMVRKGEKSTQVGPFRLFHISQTDSLPLTADSPPANIVAA